MRRGELPMRAAGATVQVVFQDNHLIAVNKPPGLICQPDGSEAKPVGTLVQEWLKVTLQKPGNVYLASIHRLDKPVSGTLLFAKTTKAAQRMSLAFKNRDVSKKYLALVHGQVHQAGGTIAGSADMGESDLHWRFLRLPSRASLPSSSSSFSLIEVSIASGKKHQIRRQLAVGLSPIVGDVLFGGKPIFSASPHDREENDMIFLHAHTLEFSHPVSREKTRIESLPRWLIS